MPNRVVVSPMCQYNSNNGSTNDWHLMHLGNMSLGCAGLVMTEMTDVNPQGRISPRCAGLWSDENEAALKRVHDFCRQYGVAKLGVQLAHAGRKGPTTPPAAGGKADPGRVGRLDAGGALGDPYDTGWAMPKEMTKADIKRCIDEFAAAARRVDRIGYDVIELHGAHGYLGHQFLSPISNQRTDEYGGSLQNRMRFVIEMYEAVRAAWPDNKPIGIRVSATDWVDGGWTPDETVALARELKTRGLDYMDVSTGGLSPLQKISAVARLPDAVCREGEDGSRHHHDVGRPDRRRAAGGGYPGAGQSRPDLHRPRRAVGSALGLARGRGARRRDALCAEDDGVPSEAQAAAFPETGAGRFLMACEADLPHLVRMNRGIGNRGARASAPADPMAPAWSCRLTGDSRRRTKSALAAARFSTFLSRSPLSMESRHEARLLRRYRLGVLKDPTTLVDITPVVHRRRQGDPRLLINAVIERFAHYRGKIEQAVSDGKVIPLESVKLRPPVPRPGNIDCMAVNYAEEMIPTPPPINGFHKSPNASSAPAKRWFFPMCRRRSSKGGRACGGDRQARRQGQRRRCDELRVRLHQFHRWIGPRAAAAGQHLLSSEVPAETFAPIGPYLVTADEIADPHKLQVKLWVNGTLKQDYSTADMANKIPRCVEWVSSIHHLDPGDIIATGTNHGGLNPFMDGRCGGAGNPRPGTAQDNRPRRSQADLGTRDATGASPQEAAGDHAAIERQIRARWQMRTLPSIVTS